jgi:hypothetical protein
MESSNFAGHVQKNHRDEYVKHLKNGKFNPPEGEAFEYNGEFILRKRTPKKQTSNQNK